MDLIVAATDAETASAAFAAVVKIRAPAWMTPTGAAATRRRNDAKRRQANESRSNDISQHETSLSMRPAGEFVLLCPYCVAEIGSPAGSALMISAKTLLALQEPNNACKRHHQKIPKCRKHFCDRYRLTPFVARRLR